MPRSNPNIPLATKNFSIADAIQTGTEDRKRNKLLDLAATGQQQDIDLRGSQETRAQEGFDLNKELVGREEDLKSAAALAIRVKPILESGNFAGALQEVEKAAQGGDESAQQLAQLFRNSDEATINQAINGAISVAERMQLIGPEIGPNQRTPSATQVFNNLLEQTKSEDPEVSQAARVALGLEARAGTESSQERIASDPSLTAAVGDSQASIAEKRKFAEQTGASRAKTIDAGFESVQSINRNLRNIDKAIAAIDAGANTGVVETTFYPTLQEATIKLEQIQGELALDVVGATTFGALSKGELDLAREVALPTGLQPEALKTFLLEKKAAQEKLGKYYEDQIDFLDQGGTVAGFLRDRGRNTSDEDRLKAMGL